jgi:RHS repeat-associated protein
MQADQQARADLLELVEAGDVPIETPSVEITSLHPTNATSNIYYYHTNHLGSTAFVTDQNQNVTQGFLYAPFGEITTEYNATFGNDIIPKYSFNAKELDEETGMYYYEARYYKPPVFTSRDPMFEKYFWVTPYAYCANNPVKYVDPSGKEALENTDWVKKKGTNQYIWVDYVYDKSSTPAGYDYVGHDDKDILKDMGIPENYSTQQTSRNGYTSKWKPLITFPNRRNESTASLSAHANSTRNPKFASSSNKEGRVFTGITFFASVSQTSYSVDEGLDGMFYNGGLYIGFGDGSYPVYDRLKRPSGAQLNAENHITTVASCTISAQQIISNGIPKNAKVTMGYCNSNSMNLSIVFEWQIIQR